MSQAFHAIYEHGILRPLTPLNLPESAEVAGVLQLAHDATSESQQLSSVELRRQQEALNAMFNEVDRLPQAPRNDGLSGRDHDKILYGDCK